MPAKRPVQPDDKPALLGLPRPEGGWRLAALALALLQPGLGLGLALLYWRADDPGVRRFGRLCLGLALAGWLVGAAGSALREGLQGGEGHIQPY